MCRNHHIQGRVLTSDLTGSGQIRSDPVLRPSDIQHLYYPSVGLSILIGDHLVRLIVLKVKS